MEQVGQLASWRSGDGALGSFFWMPGVPSIAWSGAACTGRSFFVFACEVGAHFCSDLFFHIFFGTHKTIIFIFTFE